MPAPATPSSTHESFRSVALQFFKKVGVIVGAALCVVIVAALALGEFHPFGLSNLLFWASLVVLAISVFPAIGELGAGFKSLQKSLASDQGLKNTVADKHERREKWLSTSVLFGAAGVVIFILSFFVATLVAAR